MPTWVRVKDKSTGHEYDVAESALDPEVHTRLSSRKYPDVSGPYARPRPAKHNTTKAGRPANAGGHTATEEME